MYYLYILLCKGNTLYTGITNDPDKRLVAHLAGAGARYTRSHPPLRIVYREEFPDKSSAARREFQIKSWDRAKKIRELELQLI